MPEQDLLSISFDYAKTDEDAKKVVASLRQVLAVAKEVESVKISFGDNAGRIIALTKASEEYAKTLKQTDSVLVTHVKNTGDLNNAIEKSEKIRQQQLKTDQQVVKLMQEEERQEQQQLKTKKLKTTELERSQKAALLDKKIAEQAANEYFNLSKALQDAELRYKNLALTQGFGHEQTKVALQDALAIRKTLNAVDQSLGNYQRNVGNYGSAFNGLGVSIQQILREAPSAAVSLNTFFLAISNNLPMFFDELQKAKAQIAETNKVVKEQALLARLAAEAEAIQAGATKEAAIAQGILAEKTQLANLQQTKTPSLLKQIGSSLFSINSLMTVGVLVLTLFGGKIVDFVSGLFKANQSLEDLQKNLKNVNDVVGEANKTAGAQIATLKILRSTAQDLNATDQERLAAVKELQKMFPKTYEQLSDEIILNGKDKEATDELTKSLIAAARARAAKGKIDEIESKRLDIQFQKEKIRNATQREINAAQDRVLTSGGGGGSLSFGGTGATSTVTITRQEQVKRIEERRKGALAEQDALDKSLENQANFLIKFAGGESKITQTIVEEGGKAKVAREKNTKETESEFNKLIRKLQDFYSHMRKLAIDNKDAIAPPVAPIQKQVEDDSNAYEKSLERRIRANDTAFAKEQNALLDNYREGKTKKEDYEKELLKVTEKYGKQGLQIQIDELEAEKNFAFNGVEQTQEVADKKAEIEKKLAELRLALSKQVVEQEETDRLKSLKKLEEYLQKAQGVIGEVSGLIGSVVDISVTKQKNALQELEDLRQASYQNELERVQNSTLTEEEKANRVKILEAQRQAQKDEFDRKNREADLKRAKFNKAAAVAQIALEGALAVVHQLSSGDPYTAVGRAIAAGVLSASKLAVAIATPIPKYAKGTQNHPGGAAIYGEAGAEVVTEPGKRPYMVDTPTLGILPRGTKVQPLKSDEVNNMLYRAMALQTAQSVSGPSKADQLLEGIYNELKHGKAKKGEIGVRLRDNRGYDKWKLSVDKQVRGL